MRRTAAIAALATTLSCARAVTPGYASDSDVQSVVCHSSAECPAGSVCHIDSTGCDRTGTCVAEMLCRHDAGCFRACDGASFYAPCTGPDRPYVAPVSCGDDADAGSPCPADECVYGSVATCRAAMGPLSGCCGCGSDGRCADPCR